MKALITGSNGFVGSHLKEELLNNGYDVITTDIASADINADLCNFDDVKSLIENVNPDLIFHLAGQSSVGISWKKPQLTFEINVNASLNLFEAVRISKKPIRIVVIGSSDEYGKAITGQSPIKETLIPQPQNPYAVSKYTQEQMALLYYNAYNTDIVLTRSFNHSGAGQKTGFFIPDFAYQIAQIENGAKPVIYVGNLSAKRDISHVDDVVNAYRLLGEKGVSGQVYNVGSGVAYSIEEMLNMLIEISHIKPEIIIDETKLRPIDIPLVVCDISKIKADTGFVPKYSIKDTLQDTLNYWRNMAVS